MPDHDVLHYYPPPHFHIRATSGEAKFRIDTLECIVGEIDRRDTNDAMGCAGMRWDALGCAGMRWDALGWAGSNRAIHWAKWAELNEEES